MNSVKHTRRKSLFIPVRMCGGFFFFLSKKKALVAPQDVLGTFLICILPFCCFFFFPFAPSWFSVVLPPDRSCGEAVISSPPQEAALSGHVVMARPLQAGREAGAPELVIVSP